MDKLTAMILTVITVPAIGGGIMWQRSQDSVINPVASQATSQKEFNTELETSTLKLKEQTTELQRQIDLLKQKVELAEKNEDLKIKAAKEEAARDAYERTLRQVYEQRKMRDSYYPESNFYGYGR